MLAQSRSESRVSRRRVAERVAGSVARAGTETTEIYPPHIVVDVRIAWESIRWGRQVSG
jgi:hypothetical protein